MHAGKQRMKRAPEFIKTCIEQEFEIDRLRVWHTLSAKYDDCFSGHLRSQSAYQIVLYLVCVPIARNYVHNGQFKKFIKFYEIFKN